MEGRDQKRRSRGWGKKREKSALEFKKKAAGRPGPRAPTVEVLDRALAGDDGLHEEAEGREQREAAVLDLLHLQLSEGLGVIGQAKGVKGAAGVKGIQALCETRKGQGGREEARREE